MYRLKGKSPRIQSIFLQLIIGLRGQTIPQFIYYSSSDTAHKAASCIVGAIPCGCPVGWGQLMGHDKSALLTPMHSSLQGDWAEKRLLLHTDALVLPHLKHGKERDNNHQTGSFMLNQFGKLDAGAF